MSRNSVIRIIVLAALVCGIAALPLLAQVNAYTATEPVRDTGTDAIWVFANLSYAGMRAQASKSNGWRIISFIFGFPGTLLSLFVVQEGGGRVYGVDMPRRPN